MPPRKSDNPRKSKHELAAAVGKQVGMYTKYSKYVLTGLYDVLMECMLQAEVGVPSEVQLCQGVIIGGKRYPERDWTDPRDYSPIHVEEYVTPYAKFSQSFRKELKRRSREQNSQRKESAQMADDE